MPELDYTEPKYSEDAKEASMQFILALQSLSSDFIRIYQRHPRVGRIEYTFTRENLRILDVATRETLANYEALMQVARERGYDSLPLVRVRLMHNRAMGPTGKDKEKPMIRPLMRYVAAEFKSMCDCDERVSIQCAFISLMLPGCL